jgi:hypothetical protein
VNGLYPPSSSTVQRGAKAYSTPTLGVAVIIYKVLDLTEKFWASATMSQKNNTEKNNIINRFMKF